MTKLALCCCSAISFFVVSCAQPARELPADQANKIRQHRIAPSEDMDETNRSKEGTPLPTSSDGSWKF